MFDTRSIVKPIAPPQVFDMFIKDLRASGIAFNWPTDPGNGSGFMQLLNRDHDNGPPCFFRPNQASASQ